MAVTKATRFQVLKRDGHACQYCGAEAPNAKLTVDHVIPVALGGSDKPDNLVAACRDCNAGKGASSPDNDLVQRLSAEAATYALEVANKSALVEQQIIAEEAFVDEFDEAWGEWVVGTMARPARKPHDYRNTIVRWHKQGITMTLIQYAIEISMKSRADDKFRYMCGVVYRRLEDADVSYTLGEPKITLHTGEDLVEAYEKGYEAGAARWKDESLDRGIRFQQLVYSYTDHVARHIDRGLADATYRAMPAKMKELATYG